MCDSKKMKENPRPWIIGGVIGLLILVGVIVLIVVLATNDSNSNDSNNIGNNGGDDTNDMMNNTSVDINDTNDDIDTMDTIIDSDKTNILFIIVDDLGWTDISREGHGSEYSTPNLDSIYDIGIELTNYYVHPVCTPTRASFLTGKYAWRLGLQNIQTMPPGVNESIPLNVPTIAELLSSDDLGYITYYVGKWHLGYGSWNMTPTGRGFNYGIGLLQGEGTFYSHEARLGWGDNQLTGYDMFDLTNKKPYYKARGIYSTDVFYDIATDYLSNHIDGSGIYSNKPFYMYLSWQTIHEPMEDPPLNNNMSYSECESLFGEREEYCNKMIYFDNKLGNLTNWLKVNGLYDNTLIVLTTDNGGMTDHVSTIPTPDYGFFLPGSYGCNYPYRGGKATLFEGGVKAIGVIAGKPIEDMGLDNTQSNLLLHSVDWFTTILKGINNIDNITQFIYDNGYTNTSSSFVIDGINIFDYINGNEDLFDRYYIYPGVDNTNSLDSNFNYSINGTDNYDCVIWNDIETKTTWKYIRGLQYYWNYYYCNTSDYIIGFDENISLFTDLYESTYEWLFNITDNPYEYENLNYLSPYYDNTNNNINLTYINNIKSHLQNKIIEEQNVGFIQEQEGTGFNINGIPLCNNGTWSPWLNDDGTNIIPRQDCRNLILQAGLNITDDDLDDLEIYIKYAFAS